jgi:hypothetical protein
VVGALFLKDGYYHIFNGYTGFLSYHIPHYYTYLFYRLLQFPIAILFFIFLLKIIPNKRVALLTRFGEYSLLMVGLHQFILYGKNINLVSFIANLTFHTHNLWIDLAIIAYFILICMALCWILSSRIVRQFFSLIRIVKKKNTV